MDIEKTGLEIFVCKVNGSEDLVKLSESIKGKSDSGFSIRPFILLSAGKYFYVQRRWRSYHIIMSTGAVRVPKKIFSSIEKVIPDKMYSIVNLGGAGYSVGVAVGVHSDLVRDSLTVDDHGVAKLSNCILYSDIKSKLIELKKKHVCEIHELSQSIQLSENYLRSVSDIADRFGVDISRGL